MRRYVLRRLLHLIPLLFGVSVVLFLVIQAAPGGPEGSLFASGTFVDPEVVAAYRHRLGTDQPIVVQYVRWIGAIVLYGDLGLSFSTSRPVAAMIAERLPATIELMLASFVLAAVVAFPLGIFGAARRGGAADAVGTGLSFVGIAMPAFWLGLILQLVFAVQLGWLPISGTHTVGFGSFGDHLAHLVLPAVVLSLRNIAGWSRYVRGSMLGVLSADFVRTARAKGRGPLGVLVVHALRNALLPVVSVMALTLADLFSGAVVTETVFAWPGIGRLFVQGMMARDYPLLMGILVFGSAMVLVLNLVADVLYAYLDPRVRYD